MGSSDPELQGNPHNDLFYKKSPSICLKNKF